MEIAPEPVFKDAAGKALSPSIIFAVFSWYILYIR
jgi:hypothetical protein